MSSYWQSEDVVQIGEMQVSVPAENGLSYTVGSVARRIAFDLPANQIEFLSGKDSYLEFDMDIQYPAAGVPTRLQLDPAGAGMIVQNLRIYDGGRGNLIEEINEYNQIVAMRHDYDTDQSKKNTRALMEGATNSNPRHEGTRGSSKSDMQDLTTNPWFGAANDFAARNVAYDPNVNKQSVHCCIPLENSGVFSGQVYPNMLTGLYIEIDLMPAPRVVRQLDSVTRFRRPNLNPVFAGAHKTADAAGVVTAPWNMATADDVDWIWLDIQANQITDISQVPFVVGETINLCRNTAPLVAGDNQTINMSTSAAAGVFAPATISSIEIDASGGANNGYVKLLFTADMRQNAAAGGRGFNAAAGTTAVYSCAVEEAATYPVEYNVNNLNLVCHTLQMADQYKAGMLAKAREGGAIEFDIFSATNYKNSMLASERQASFLIHAQNRKAKSLLCLPTDSSVYTDKQLVCSNGTYETTRDAMDGLLNSARSGISGCCDQLSELQFQINGNLVPARPVSTRKIATRESIDAFHIFELEKGLSNAGITPHSFTKYMDNFVISRGFAVNSGVMDLRDKDLSVQLKYLEATAPTKPKMFSTFVFHLRRLVISGGTTTVIE